MQNVFSNLFGDDEQWRQYTTRNFSSVACHPEVFDYYSQFCGVPFLKDKYIGKLFNCYHLLDKSYSNYCTFYECTRQQASADFSLAIRQATVTCSRDSKLKWSIQFQKRNSSSTGIDRDSLQKTCFRIFSLFSRMAYLLVLLPLTTQCLLSISSL